MDNVSIEKVDDVYIRVNADPGIKMEMSEYFTFEVPGAKFMPAVRNKVWDGKIRLLNTMTGMIYAGLLPYIIKFCNDRDYEVEVDSSLLPETKYYENAGYDLAKDFDSAFEPRDYQNDAVAHALYNNRSLFLSPTASGKSFIIYLLSRHHVEQGRKVLIVVPTTSLVSQMSSDFVEYNKNRPLDIHKIMGGVDKNVDADYTVTTWQSIYKFSREWYENFGCVVGDEVHLFKAKSLSGIMNKCVNAEYRFGMTGTLDGTATNKLVLEGLFGVTKRVTMTRDLQEKGTLAKLDISILLLRYHNDVCHWMKGKTYQEEIDYIVTNEKRNRLITNLAADQKGNSLVLFQFVEKHGKPLFDMIRDKVGERPVYYVSGEVDAKDREQIRGIVEKQKNAIIVASLGTFSTGINIRNLHNIIFASPSKSQVKVLQSIGRALRMSDDGSVAKLYDIADDFHVKSHKNFTLKHSGERIKIYSKEQFPYNIFKLDLK